MDWTIYHLGAALLAALMTGALAWHLATERLARRRFANKVARFAASLGLTSVEKGGARGDYDGMSLHFGPSTLGLKMTGRTHATTIDVHMVEASIPEGEDWVVCSKAEMDKLFSPPPELDGEVQTGDRALDGALVIRVRGEPAFPFWQDLTLMRSLLDAELILARAGHGELRASFYRADALQSAGDPSQLRRAVLSTLAMTSSDRALEYRPRLAEPKARRMIPSAMAAFMASAFAGIVGGLALDYPGGQWQGGVLAGLVAFVAVLGAVASVNALRRRATASRSDAEWSDGPRGGAYR